MNLVTPPRRRAARPILAAAVALLLLSVSGLAAPPKNPEAVDDFVTMTADEQRAALALRLSSALGDAGKLQAFHAWLSDPKLAGNEQAKKVDASVLDEAIRVDAKAAWARTARGDHPVRDALEACRKECTQAFDHADPDEKALIDRLDRAETEPWASLAEWTKLEALMKRIRERDEKIRTDPRWKLFEEKRDWIRRNDAFKDVQLTYTHKDPYVIFQEIKSQDPHDQEKYRDADGMPAERPKATINPARVRQNEDWKKKAELFAKRDEIIFCELNRRFRELFAERFKLPQLEEKGRMLTGLVMWNRKSFDDFLRQAGNPVDQMIRAFYSPVEQKIFHYVGDDSMRGQDEIRCSKGRIQKLSDQVTFHEGTHQLQHEYAAIYQGRPLRDDQIVLMARRAMWFEEGLAEFMGAVEVEEDKAETLEGATFQHNRILLERIREGRETRKACHKWRIRDLLVPNNNEDLKNVGEKLLPGDDGMPSHFYARAWALCHFLWYYDGGKYREKFMQYMQLVLEGTQSSEKFAKIMGRPMNDWGPIEKEYEWYWERLLGRNVAPKTPAQREKLSTDAPTGKVEDDPDFTWDPNNPDGDDDEK